mmetsp:Transcript_7446/g.27345  ORF Transcript_7446/g.27345 Transcript_7446/m.27345 type:complete len:508 (+) Transcript_7446:86-1609(+)
MSAMACALARVRSASGRGPREAASTKLLSRRRGSLQTHFATGDVVMSELFYGGARRASAHPGGLEVFCGKKKQAKKQQKAAERRAERLSQLMANLVVLQESEAPQTSHSQELLSALAKEVAEMNTDLKQQAEWMCGSSSSSSSSDSDCGKKKKRKSEGKQERAQAYKDARQKLANSDLKSSAAGIAAEPSILEQARALASDNGSSASVSPAVAVEATTSPTHAKATIAVCTGKKCLRQGSLHLYSALDKTVRARKSGALSSGTTRSSVETITNIRASTGASLIDTGDTTVANGDSLDALLQSVVTLAEDVEMLDSIAIDVRESKCVGCCGEVRQSSICPLAQPHPGTIKHENAHARCVRAGSLCATEGKWPEAQGQCCPQVRGFGRDPRAAEPLQPAQRWPWGGRQGPLVRPGPGSDCDGGVKTHPCISLLYVMRTEAEVCRISTSVCASCNESEEVRYTELARSCLASTRAKHRCIAVTAWRCYVPCALAALTVARRPRAAAVCRM